MYLTKRKQIIAFEQTAVLTRPKKKHRVRRIVGFMLLIIFLLYWALSYCIVSACLVPSFMQKLDAFEEITKKSYAQQVQTTDIKKNRKVALSDMKLWLKSAEREKHSVMTADGYRLVATEFAAENAESHDWVLLLHGYTGWKEEMYQFAYWYFQQGFHVMAPDLRCQGESEGDFIGMGYTDSEDCMLWLQMILEMDPEAQIILHGQSMGAATALMMSGNSSLPSQVRGVISDCAYTDAYSMFGDKITEWFSLPPFPLVDSSCLMLKLRGGYDLRDASALVAVSRSHTPTLFIHGSADKMISVDMSKLLYENASCEKELVIIEGAGHAQAQDKNPEVYYQAIMDFMQIGSE